MAAVTVIRLSGYERILSCNEQLCRQSHLGGEHSKQFLSNPCGLLPCALLQVYVSGTLRVAGILEHQVHLKCQLHLKCIRCTQSARYTWNALKGGKIRFARIWDFWGTLGIWLFNFFFHKKPPFTTFPRSSRFSLPVASKIYYNRIFMSIVPLGPAEYRLIANCCNNREYLKGYCHWHKYHLSLQQFWVFLSKNHLFAASSTQLEVKEKGR